jgi:peptidoglycan/LPS O-acetylase OafA/YrhL
VHGTVLIAVQILFPQLQIWWVVALLVLPISLGLAFLSWTFIEHPVLAQKSRIAHAIDDLAERASEILPPVRLLTGRAAGIVKAARPAKGD